MRYYLTYDKTTIELSGLINSANTTIKHPQCTTSMKSAAAECSFTLTPMADKALYRSAISRIITAKDTYGLYDATVEIKEGASTLFKGYLDQSSIDITTGSLPESVTVGARDYTILLDQKIDFNWIIEDVPLTYVVNYMIAKATNGYATIDLSSDVDTTVKVPHFSVSEDDGKTYRDVLDQLISERAPGYVLRYDASVTKFKVETIQITAVTPRQVHYMTSNKLKTSSKIYDHDGILLSYPTVEERAGQNLYSESFGEFHSEADDAFVIDEWTDSNGIKQQKTIKVKAGTITGKYIRSGMYYPEDGDVTETYQEYTDEGLDRAYITKQSRKKNDDLALLYAKDAKYQVMGGNGLEVAPAISNIGWDGYCKYWPKKAWVLLKNTTTDYVSLTGFNIIGTAVYVSKMNKLTLPKVITNPDEYEAKYIETEEEATAFANWYYNSVKCSKTTSEWYGFTKDEYTLGETVNVIHKETGKQQKHVIVQIDDQGLQGKLRQYHYVAISVEGFQTYTADVQSTTASHVTNGKSAYELWIDAGNTGTMEDYLNSLGTTYEYYWSTSATEVTGDSQTFTFGGKKILVNGVVMGNFSAQNWDEVLSQKPNDGRRYYLWCRINGGTWFRITGEDGVTPTIGDNGNWFIDGVDTGCSSVGDDGHSPYVQDGYWYEWDPSIGAYHSTGIKAKGDKGDAGTPAYVWGIKMSSETYARDLRDSSANQTITLEADIQGYSGKTAHWMTSDGILSSDVGNSVTLTIKRNTSSNKVTVTLTDGVSGGLTAQKTLVAVDGTQYEKYWGKGTIGTLLAGDSRFDTSDNLIKYYDGSNWVALSQSGLTDAKRSEICAKAQRDALSTIQPGTVLQSDYGYFNDIITGTITADYVGAKSIQLKSGGRIKSSGISDSDVGAKQLDKVGFALDGDTGSIQANGMYAKSINIKDGTFSSISSSDLEFGYDDLMVRNVNYTLGTDGKVGRLINLLKATGMEPGGARFSGTITYSDGTQLSDLNGTVSIANDLRSVRFLIRGYMLDFYSNFDIVNGTIYDGVDWNTGAGAAYTTWSSGPTISITVFVSLSKPVVKGLLPWGIRSSHGSSSYSHIGNPGMPFDNGFFKKITVDELVVNPSSIVEAFKLYYGSEISIPLSNGLVIKFKLRGESPSSTWSGNETWTFNSPFPNECLWAFSVMERTVDDDYYYGYAYGHDRFHVNFHQYMSFSYRYIAIGY